MFAVVENSFSMILSFFLFNKKQTTSFQTNQEERYNQMGKGTRSSLPTEWGYMKTFPSKLIKKSEYLKKNL